MYRNVLSFVGIVSLGIILSPKTALRNVLCRPKPATFGPVPQPFEDQEIKDTLPSSSYSPWESALRTGLAALAETNESPFLDSVDIDSLLHELETKLNTLSKSKSNPKPTTTKNDSKENSTVISVAVAPLPQVVSRQFMDPISVLPEFSRLMDAYEHVLDTSSRIVGSPYMINRLLPTKAFNNPGTESGSSGTVNDPDLPDPVDLPKGWSGVAVDLDDDGAGGSESSRLQQHGPTAGQPGPLPLFAGTLLESTRQWMRRLEKDMGDRLDNVSLKQYLISLSKTRDRDRRRKIEEEWLAEGHTRHDQEGDEEVQDFLARFGIEDDDDDDGMGWTRMTDPRFQLLQTGALHWTNVSLRVQDRLLRAERAAWDYTHSLSRLDKAYKGPTDLATDIALLEPWFPHFDNVAATMESVISYIFTMIVEEELEGNNMEAEGMGSGDRPRAGSPRLGGSNDKNATIREEDDNDYKGPYPDEDNEPPKFELPKFERYYQDEPMLAARVSRMNPPLPWASRHEWELWVLRLVLDRSLGEFPNRKAWSQYGYLNDTGTGIARLLDATSTLNQTLIHAGAALDTVRDLVALWMTGYAIGEYETYHARSLSVTVWEHLFGGVINDKDSGEEQWGHRASSIMRAVAELDRGARHIGRARELLGRAKAAMENARDARADMMARLVGLVETKLLDVSLQVDVDVDTHTRRHREGEEAEEEEEEETYVVALTLTSIQYYLTPSNIGDLLEKMAGLNTRLLDRAHQIREDWELVREDSPL